MNNLSPLFDDLQKAIQRLEEVLEYPNKDSVSRDSAIKRFELCFDLSWKVLKHKLHSEGVECYSPRSCFKAAFQTKLIDANELWLQMINDRNNSVHVYNEGIADTIYQHLPQYIVLFKAIKG